MRVAVEAKLQNLTQSFSSDEAAQPSSSQMAASSATAELYRLASLLYLLRVVSMNSDEAQRVACLNQAFDTLKQVRVATSPCPVFIFACEARTEEQRIHIWEVLECMDSARNVGNVRVMRTIIQTIWKQQDIREPVNLTRTVPWWLCIESSLPVPWFA